MLKHFFAYSLIFIAYIFISSSCTKADETILPGLSREQTIVLNSIPPIAIIAHRGTIYWAPEGTEAAMRWARNVGASYLECDLQRTKDGYIVIYHDNNLLRTSDIVQKFPKRKDLPISNFTLEELLSLDLGSWFNSTVPSNARTSFKGLDILTLEDLIKIAEGYRIKRDASQRRIYTTENGRIITQYEADPADNGNRPGIYPETKKPELYPGIEKDLKKELERLGWYAENTSALKVIKTTPGCIGIANTVSRVIVQTFSQESLIKLGEAFPRLIPFCFLIGINNNEEANSETYQKWIDFAVNHKAVIIGPCIYERNSLLGNLLKPWMYDLIKEKNLLIHAYTFSTQEQIAENIDLVDGFFTNQTDNLISYLVNSGKKPLYKPTNNSMGGSYILNKLGY